MSFTPTYIDYIASIDLEQYFVDNATGLPLVNGYVTFAQDTARTAGQTVYQITGPNGGPYTFEPYGFLNSNGLWQINLTSVGTFQYTPYYLPYDSEGNVSLYYIVVYNSDNVQQFSLPAWPPGLAPGSQPEGETININYIPNPQFLAQNETALGAEIDTSANNGITQIAYGNWFYQVNANSSTVDYITFPLVGTVATPPANPKYACEIYCATPNASDTMKDLYVSFPYVNTFCNGSGYYTFSFEAYASAGISVEAYIYRNFGTGGSTSIYTSLHTFSVTTAWNQFSIAFQFPSNTGQTIGTQGDDFVALLLRFPVNTTFRCTSTNFLLTVGQLSSPQFPDTTQFEVSSNATAGSIPLPAIDGSNFGLPLILTENGIDVDTSVVGTIFASQQSSLPYALLCDGTSYVTGLSGGNTTYVAGGLIPITRLANTVWNNVINSYPWGTGTDFANTYLFSSSSNTLAVFNNLGGYTTAATDVSTGFTITNVISPSGSIISGGTGVQGYYLGVGYSNFYMIANGFGNTTSPTASSSPASNISVLVLKDITSVTQGSPVKPTYLVSVTNTPAASSYLTFYNAAGTQYYLWFKVNGSGSDPAPGGLGIQINISSSYTNTQIALLCSQAVNAQQSFLVSTTSGSSITGGSFFEFTTLGAHGGEVVVWYTVSGVGTQPSVGNYIYVNVPIESTDGATTVAEKTQTALNQYSFATPDLQGRYLAGVDLNGYNDFYAALRYSANPVSSGSDLPGNYYYDTFAQHAHQILTYSGSGSNTYIQVATGTSTTTWSNTSGFAQTAPNSMSTYWYIHL